MSWYMPVHAFFLYVESSSALSLLFHATVTKLVGGLPSFQTTFFLSLVFFSNSFLHCFPFTLNSFNRNRNPLFHSFAFEAASVSCNACSLKSSSSAFRCRSRICS